ncbi:polysaccharide deacetylase family protein [Kaarinaea lacus]
MKKRSLLFIICLLIIHHAAADQTSHGEKQAVIFMYHHFGENQYPSTNIRLEQFDAQLEYLADNNYQVWPLSRITQYIKEGKEFPGRVVAITVDDAYVSVYTEAFPRLRKRSWPFTVFVSTDGIDKKYKSYMTWEQMRDMQPHGVTFANHSASHDYLVRHSEKETLEQWKQRVTEDIQRAQRRLNEELGNAPLLFAYPYGEYNTELSTIIGNMGYVAFGQHSGPAGSGGDLLALPRFPMAEKFAAFSEFKQKLNSLAFPILKQSPWDPVFSENNNPPLLELTLGDSDARVKQLTCFVSGQGRVDIRWKNREKNHFSVQAKSPLGAGRSRYNCTAPSPQAGRFYWYSHLWINPSPEQ